MDSFHLLLALFFFVGLIYYPVGAALIDEDKQALLDFVNRLPHSRSLNWDESSTVCKHWTGVTCSQDGNRVIAVRLPAVGFHGPIPADTLGKLSALQILSLRSNGIYGSFPLDLYNLKNLSNLYLQFNKFSGPLPSEFSAWKNLTIVNLSNNGFNGSLPASISNLTQLTALNLANNSLSGEIPDVYLPNLEQLDLSNNQFIGNVPSSLRKFPKSAFMSNNLTLGNSSLPVTGESPVSSPSNSTNRKKPMTDRRISEAALLGIIVAASILGLIVITFVLVVCYLRRRGENVFSGKTEKGEMSPEKVISRSQDANNRLFFFEGCSYVFDLEDLLRASAEVLGKGTFGMAYKAILEDANTVVVKRLKEVGVGKREFEQHMELVGNIKHENLVELRAYYYSKDEKLLVYDYYSEGSVAAILHGKKGDEKVKPGLDWETRWRVAIGAARGIAHIHDGNGGKLVHGNVRSSNIFLNPERYGVVSDLGLSAIMGQLSSPIARAAGYRAPEVTDTRKALQPSDVYSFGVLLLELLTGKSPVHAAGGDEVVHLVRWVHSVVREEWTAEVFDVELLKCCNIEEEMVEMLQIALACVTRMADQRPKMGEIVGMIENVRRIQNENRPSSEGKSGSSTPYVGRTQWSPSE
ncbi:probable inactive receptor kinase At4g23740 [Impatiens glandulifera]|uniref:probable inactive receptor kinase At4g23740 n=1 Tax=Impatiens glandulifera TaxID=253017 RepID=UPI001FB0C7C5|nr:probable inactive receptor kinase At4g23740 [Impatiens glandulifera]